MIHSHAVGVAVARPCGYENDFVRDFIYGSAAWFFVFYVANVVQSKDKLVWPHNGHIESVNNIWLQVINNYLNFFLLQPFNRKVLLAKK